MLVIRGVGLIGYPGSAEVVNMRPPGYLLSRGVHALPWFGDGRQSSTSGSPSILNACINSVSCGSCVVFVDQSAEQVASLIQLD